MGKSPPHRLMVQFPGKGFWTLCQMPPSNPCGIDWGQSTRWCADWRIFYETWVCMSGNGLSWHSYKLYDDELCIAWQSVHVDIVQVRNQCWRIYIAGIAWYMVWWFSMNVSGMKCVGWFFVQMIYVWRNSLRLEAVWYTYNSTAAVGYSWTCTVVSMQKGVWKYQLWSALKPWHTYEFVLECTGVWMWPFWDSGCMQDNIWKISFSTAGYGLWMIHFWQIWGNCLHWRCQPDVCYVVWFDWKTRMNGCWMSGWIFHLWHVRWVVLVFGVFTECYNWEDFRMTFSFGYESHDFECRHSWGWIFLQRFFSRKRNSTTGRRQAKQKHVALCCGVKECDLTVRELNLCFGCFCPVTVF